jgi:hypothetical protein
MAQLERAEAVTQTSMATGGWRDLPVKPRPATATAFTYLAPAFLVLGALFHRLWVLDVVACLMGMYEYARLMPRVPDAKSITGSMMDMPAQQNQFPVWISLTHKYDPYGKDMGVLTVMDGGIHFSGEQTDFSLSHRNARLKARDPYPLRPSQPPRQYLIDFWVGDFRGQLVVEPVGKTSGDLCAALLSWGEASPSLAWEATLDPPITKQPGRFLPRSWVPLLQVWSYLEALLAMELGISPHGSGGSDGMAIVRFMTLIVAVSLVFWFGLRSKQKGERAASRPH